jgi:Ca2+-transporting ATPase
MRSDLGMHFWRSATMVQHVNNATITMNNFDVSGLTDHEVAESRKKFGFNKLMYKKENNFFDALVRTVKDPMLILLLAASTLYYITGHAGDGIFMTSAVILVACISLYQDSRSRNALGKLKSFSQSNCKVIRNGEITDIKSEDLVVGDSLVVEEGTLIVADGEIVHSNDFSVNESILTGEFLPVFKDKTTPNNTVYNGTTVASGLAIATITAIGNSTQLGKIGKSLEGIEEEKTPLESQISDFVKKMAIAGALIFMVVWAINYWHTHNWMNSLLQSLTLAMSILPEEIPVAFTTFMALGAWRLMKMGIVVKHMKTVETLGSATVICTDKTGTITENKMSLAKVYAFATQQMYDTQNPSDKPLQEDAKAVITLAMWASEPIPFDPMEIALHQAYGEFTADDERPNYAMVHEYPLGGKPPMMTHVFENKAKKRIVSAKGAPEALMNICPLSTAEKKQINNAIQDLTTEGYRVLGIGEAVFDGDDFPPDQQDFEFSFKGIVAFYDPPKKNISAVLDAFYKAGIAVKIITGDHAETTISIAKEVGFKGYDKTITGDELMELSESALNKTVLNTHIFTRMFPDAKLKIINALKTQNEIVAMTGDGVNDGPALKAAHIGIAMGKKGTEIAKQAASLILLEDDLSKMVDAIAMGRKIYTNLKKAIQYIISIHIPIILMVFVPLALGWIYPNIFSPVHVIFLELIMGPTCSIIYENEPLEKNTMVQKPRPFTTTFFNFKELLTSIIQGLSITAGTLSAYQFAVYQGYNESLTRTMVFTVLVTANVFLTLVNRSFYYSIFTTLKYKNNLVLMIISATIIILISLIYIKPLAVFFEFEYLSLHQMGISIGIGFISVIWFECVKLYRRKNERDKK